MKGIILKALSEILRSLLVYHLLLKVASQPSRLVESVSWVFGQLGHIAKF